MDKQERLKVVRDDILTTSKRFFEQSEVQVLNLKGARAAGAASRRLSMELGALCKEWRKASNDAYKPEDDNND